MAQNVRYTAAQRRAARAARQAEFDDRNARWAALDFAEFAIEYTGSSVAALPPEILADARNYHDRCKSGSVVFAG